MGQISRGCGFESEATQPQPAYHNKKQYTCIIVVATCLVQAYDLNGPTTDLQSSSASSSSPNTEHASHAQAQPCSRPPRRRPPTSNLYHSGSKLLGYKFIDLGAKPSSPGAQPPLRQSFPPTATCSTATASTECAAFARHKSFPRRRTHNVLIFASMASRLRECFSISCPSATSTIVCTLSLRDGSGDSNHSDRSLTTVFACL